MLQTTQTEPTAIARRPDTAGPLAVATPTTRKLVDASIARNSRLAYAGALRRLDAWRGTALVDDALASRLPRPRSLRRAARPQPPPWPSPPSGFGPSSPVRPDPAGPNAAARVLGGYRRTAADRGRGQAAPLSTDGLAAILATADRPRTDGRGVESHANGATPGPHGRRDRRVAVHGRVAPRRSERA